MPDPTGRASDRVVSFGPFRLLPARHLLLEADRPVRLGSRALAILVLLVERAGSLVSKDELIAHAWPGTFVEEGNLRVHVVALRKALGDGQAGARFIENVPGRGYRFVAATAISDGPAPPAPAAGGRRQAPAVAVRLVGRDEVVSQLARRVPERRFVTIVGPGGIGKSSVALAVAGLLSDSYADGVLLVDLAPIGESGRVAPEVAGALGLSVPVERARHAIGAFLRKRQMLIVLDGCEHLIEASAGLAEDILAAAPAVDLLATSRETLRAAGETVHRLLPLSVPARSDGLTAAEALVSPAIRLFVERAANGLDGYALGDEDAAAVAEICRRLDGVPLAIELAAARVDTLGISGLAALLDDRMRLLTAGRRTALPRHRTLRATLDWSHDHLDDGERLALRRLAVLIGSFDLDSAIAVVGDEVEASDIVARVASLVEKSLVSADIGGSVARYRLLDTMRAYALEKLAASGERDATARRQAEHLQRQLRRSAEAPAVAAADPPSDRAGEVANLRAALDWCFSPDGDPGLGCQLAAAAVDRWLDLSLIVDCRDWCARAIDAIGAERDTPCEMALQIAFGLASTFTRGMSAEADQALTRGIELAARHGDLRYRLRAILARRFFHLRIGELRPALALARQYHDLAHRAEDPGARAVADWLIGATHYFMGEHVIAADHLQRALDGFPGPGGQGEMIRSGSIHRLTLVGYRSANLWIRGLPDEAIRSIEAGIADARQDFQAAAHCVTVAHAARISMRRGELPAAERWIEELLDVSEKYSLVPYHTNGMCAVGTLALLRGDAPAAVERLEAGLARMGDASYRLLHLQYLPDLAQAYAAAGDLDRARATIDDALARMDQFGMGNVLPEALRIKGELMRRVDGDGDPTVAIFERAVAEAGRRGALAWELRAATGLARLHRDQGRSADARATLEPVHVRFTEGFGTADLVAARMLLDSL
ncbi:MAG: winged helix-turn-helix domain-containing protein [Alphaproteobacteria bacterium]